MLTHWRRVLPLIVVAALFIYEDRATIPSCKLVPAAGESADGQKDHPDDLKVMLVSDLLLLGSDSGFWNTIFTDYYMSKFFKKSYELLKPDLLLMLGDVFAKGSQVKRSEWPNLVQQLHRLLGPFSGLPFHVTLGDREIGECNELEETFVNWVARKFPALDSVGCGAFEIADIGFVSLNTVALLCGGNSKLRFSVEKLIERESVYRQPENKQVRDVYKSTEMKLTSVDFQWRENVAMSGSGSVLLLHFPLHQTVNSRCSKTLHKNSRFSSLGNNAGGPYDTSQSLPANVTEYIFQALRPRIVFSAHTHEFCDRTHLDGTREVTVPAMAWGAKNDPGFVFANFRKNGSIISVSHCSLTGESTFLVVYISLVTLLMMCMLLANAPNEDIS
ncbi:metallophosphoesterase 1-like isoform X2 [Impatiens glandulifera]|uniref:metallophosphoesterase 1-like isoform X2 n=1 Tax=Impatiens glandulifera TaxID=253017 RepID=UPI001FB091D5|nr:metallophosphoesterase 1-like isoform X2 [Impatiens glandulifera]